MNRSHEKMTVCLETTVEPQAFSVQAGSQPKPSPSQYSTLKLAKKRSKNIVFCLADAPPPAWSGSLELKSIVTQKGEYISVERVCVCVCVCLCVCVCVCVCL